MGILTPREKEILKYLRQGKSVKEIGRLVGTPVTSISRSITSIRRKAQDIEEDVQFFCEIGYASIEKGHLRFLTPDRDPKALSKKRE
jgi:DNA-binding NarL/FixJ family response regulator